MVTFPANAAMKKKKGKPAPTRSHHCPDNGGFCVSSGWRIIPLKGMEILTSAENTIGKHPHELVDMLNKIVESAEKYVRPEQMADTWI